MIRNSAERQQGRQQIKLVFLQTCPEATIKSNEQFLILLYGQQKGVQVTFEIHANGTKYKIVENHHWRLS